jgi:hypothetical protein
VNTGRGTYRPRRVTSDIFFAIEGASESENTSTSGSDEISDGAMTGSDNDKDDDSVKSDKGSSSRIPKFRKDSDWDMFENKFLAYADDKNFIDVIERRHPLLPDVFDGNLAVISDKRVRKVLRYNRRAVLALSEALDDSAETFAHFKSGKTIEYPKGLAYKMWNSLKATYDVKDTVTSRELRQRMREITMTKVDNPKKIANALHAIQQDSYDTDGPISDAEAIAHFTAILPFFYTSMLQVHEENMKRNGDTVTVQSIGAALHSMYRRSQMQWKTQKEESSERSKRTENKDSRPVERTDNEIALSSVNRNVKCYNCGEFGHISRACPQRNSRSNDFGGHTGRFHGKCNICGKEGHKAMQCFELTVNEHRRPQGWTSSLSPRQGSSTETNESAARAVDSSEGYELVVPMIDRVPPAVCEYELSSNILKNPYYFIGDTGASRHIFGGKKSDLQLLPPEQSYSNLGDGSVKAITERGNYYPACTDRHGKVYDNSIIFGDVGHMAKGCSLFSITKLREMGWRLMDNGDDGFSLTYEKYELKFDIKVRTPKGCVWVMYAPPRDGWKENTLTSASRATNSADNGEDENDDSEESKYEDKETTTMDDGVTYVENGATVEQKVNGSDNPKLNSEEEQPSAPIEELVISKGEEETIQFGRQGKDKYHNEEPGEVFLEQNGFDGFDLQLAVKRFWLHILEMIRFLEFVKSMALWRSVE